MDKRDCFEQYKNLLISKAQLTKECGENLHDCLIDKTIKVCKEDVIKVLEKYLTNNLEKQTMIDWVNIIWFNDAYEFKDDETDSIVSVLSVVETMDEEDSNVLDSDISNMVTCLKQNKEFHC
ncbi:MAG: hypothetical protein IJ836_02715 [Spirochaetales bacterium]|nr:hypothetical protein [Spirochaetales bacterium]